MNSRWNHFVKIRRRIIKNKNSKQFKFYNQFYDSIYNSSEIIRYYCYQKLRTIHNFSYIIFPSVISRLFVFIWITANKILYLLTKIVSYDNVVWLKKELCLRCLFRSKIIVNIYDLFLLIKVTKCLKSVFMRHYIIGMMINAYQ